MPGTVLIVDDEVQLVRHLEHLLRGEGYQVIGVHSGAEAKKAVSSFFPDVILVDLKLPDTDGNRLLSELIQRHSSAEYIIITAHGSIQSAVEATRSGAREYLTKPFEPDELLLAVRNAMKERLQEEEINVLRQSGGSTYPRRMATKKTVRSTHHQSSSEAMKNTFAQARHASSSDSIILLLGESGSGKDYLARYIHDRSRRANGPFFSINCAAVAPELAESELFGHEPGAFTGARGRKRGLLELAEGGTLLLNEIGELSLTMQAKLLSFLDTRTFTRVGGETRIAVNARLIAATNRELDKEVAQNRFRSDLYYRLNVLSIYIPPLRQRLEDLPVLIEELLSQLAAEMILPELPVLDPSTLDLMMNYNWPGNIRELRNVLERGLMLSGSGTIKLASLGLETQQESWSYTVTFPKDKNIHDVTRDMKKTLILEALRRSSGNKKEAARLLGISRHAFAHQLKAAGLEE